MTDDDAGLPAERAFGHNCRARREALGMSQEELARRMSERGFPFHQATVYKIETAGPRGRRLRLDEALALAELLGMSVHELADAPTAFDATGMPERRRRARLRQSEARLRRLNQREVKLRRELEAARAAATAAQDRAAALDSELDMVWLNQAAEAARLELLGETEVRREHPETA